MRTLFEASPFVRVPWAPARSRELGVTAEEVFKEGVEAAPDIYKAYQTGEVAEEKRRQTEAEAVAAQARTEEERARAAAEQARAAAAEGPKILGIPTPYVIIGAVLLAAGAVVLAVA